MRGSPVSGYNSGVFGIDAKHPAQETADVPQQPRYRVGCSLPSLADAQTISSETCGPLASLRLPNTTIDTAELISAGTFVPPAVGGTPDRNLTDLPPFCRVAATLKPVAGSDIKIEVWLPAATWNGKLMAVGNGGLAGSSTYTAGSGGIERGMAEALKRGYATASTDTGHTGDTAAPFLGNPEKLVDFGYRAVHEMTVTAKAIIDIAYGTRPKLSYWNGCSSGGRQGLMEAQRFSSRLRRHHCGCAGNLTDAARLVDPRGKGCSQRFPEGHSSLKVSDDSSGGRERV